MSVNIVTKEDLELFKKELISEMTKVLKEAPEKKKWLRTNEVMNLLGISEVTLQTLRNRNKIPFTKLGGICYYNAQAIDQLLVDLTIKCNL